MKKRIEQINIVFLVMVVIPYLVCFLPIQNIVSNTLASILFSQFIRFAPIVVFMWMNRYQVKTELRISKIKISSVFLLILLAYLITPVMSLISALSLLFGRNVMNSTMTDLTASFPLIVCVLAVGIIPAICEETIYRGVYLNEYSKIDKKWGIFLSAFLFGVLHQNFNQFTYAFAMGIVFALVIEATGSILASILMHFVINTTSVVNLYLYPKLLKLLETFYGSDQFNAEEIFESATSTSTDRVVVIQTILQYLLPAVICAILAFFVYRSIAKREGRYENVKAIFRQKETMGENNLKEVKLTGAGFREFITGPLLFGIGICLLEVVASMV